MKAGKFPMCKSSEVHANTSTNFCAGGDFVDLLDDEYDLYFIPIICTECGFTAMYAEDMDEVKKLPETKRWEKVK